MRKALRFVRPRLELLEARELLSGTGLSPDFASNGYGQIPLSFEMNQGQTDPRVRFLSRGEGYEFFLTPQEAVLNLSQQGGTPDNSIAQPGSSGAVLRMNLINANPHPRLTGLDLLSGTSSYFLGNDPAQWPGAIPTYAKVLSQAVYPGIDLVYYGNQQQLEYDFVVLPGADPHAIRMNFTGADGAEIDSRGDLVLHVGAMNIRQYKPVVYQEVAGVRQEIPGAFILTPGDSNTPAAGLTGRRDSLSGYQISFSLGAYNHSLPLIIDPVIFYSTYLSGGREDYGLGIALDSSDNAYVTGYTLSTDFPTTAGAYQESSAGSDDVFVTKINPDGTDLIYSTYLGGSSVDVGRGIVVDAKGNAYVTGSTTSRDFPTTKGAVQESYNGQTDAFVAEISSDGSKLVYSTYLGGRGNDFGNAIAIDSEGNALVTGSTSSDDFPTRKGAFSDTLTGETNAFVAKLNSDGTDLIFSTYLGGGGADFGRGIAVDDASDAYVTGSTTSNDFPLTGDALQKNLLGYTNAFVTKLNSEGSALVYSTYLGGKGDDFGNGLALDAKGDATITGYTDSDNFPTTPGAYQEKLYGNINAFVTQLDADGTDLLYSTFLGGSNRDYANAVAVDSAGAAYIVGQTYSGDFPTTPDAFQYDLHGTANAFVVELASDGSTLLYSTYLGGNFADGGTGLTLDSGGNAVVVGDTISKDFPTTDGAFQTELLGDAAVFVSKVEIPGFGPRTSASARAQRDRSPISEEILPGILPSRPWPVPSPFDTIAVTVTEPDQLERWNAGLGILLDSPDTPRPKPHASCPTLQDGRKLPWSGDIACWLLSACFLPED